MRTLTSGNRKLFTIFAAIIVLIVGVLFVALSCVLAVEKEEYEISQNSILYNKDCESIEATQNGKLSKNWNGNFYFKMGQEEYLIGKEAIVYIPSKRILYIYGNSFEIEENGEIIKVTKKNEIKDLTKGRLFKLEDRKYLITGSLIKNQTGTIGTEDFLIVQLDKAGNTILANHELNMKTIKPLILKNENHEFDVANEKAKIKEQEIDLKKIIGSSNKYKEFEKIEEQEETEEENKKDVQQIEGNLSNQNASPGYTNQGGYNNNNNGNQINNNPNGEQVGSSVGSAQLGGVISQQGQNQNQTQTQPVVNKTPLAKSINLRGITPRSSSLDIQYAILDPENKYQTIYLNIQGDIQKTVSLDKNQRNYLVTGLTPNTEYKVTLAYKEILKDNSVQDGVEDVIIVRTSKISDNITITKMVQGKLYFTYKMDPNYVYESGKIAFYIDGEKKTELDINIDAAVSANGWSSSVKYDYGNEMILKLEDVKYEGRTINRDLQAKIKMY